jgi:hypothetical protein
LKKPFLAEKASKVALENSWEVWISRTFASMCFLLKKESDSGSKFIKINFFAKIINW